VDVGPQFGFALNAKEKVKQNGNSGKHKNTYVNTFDLSLPIGVTYRMEDIVVSLHYNIGLTNAFDKDYAGGNNKNHVLQLSVGYCLNNLF
jgi:hypothetical protein